jgi:hypothetical protein
VSQQTTNHSFDDLARALAEGSLSRRRALKLFAGSAIAALIPSRTLADDDECVRICHVPFDRETEECDFANAETRCVSRRERRRHLENHPCDCRGRCANCLTMCLPNGDTCMANDQCCSGRCARGPGSGTCAEPCPAGRVLLSNGTCAMPCTPTGDCVSVCTCETTFSGATYCATATVTQRICNNDSQCLSSEFCKASIGFCVGAC